MLTFFFLFLYEHAVGTIFILFGQTGFTNSEDPNQMPQNVASDLGSTLSVTHQAAFRHMKKKQK